MTKQDMDDHDFPPVPKAAILYIAMGLAGIAFVLWDLLS